MMNNTSPGNGEVANDRDPPFGWKSADADDGAATEDEGAVDWGGGEVNGRAETEARSDLVILSTIRTDPTRRHIRDSRSRCWLGHIFRTNAGIISAFL